MLYDMAAYVTMENGLNDFLVILSAVRIFVAFEGLYSFRNLCLLAASFKYSKEDKR